MPSPGFIQGVSSVVGGLTKSPFKKKREKNMAAAKKTAKPATVKIAESLKQIKDQRAETAKKKLKQEKEDFKKATKLDLGRGRSSTSGARRF